MNHHHIPFSLNIWNYVTVWIIWRDWHIFFLLKKLLLYAFIEEGKILFRTFYFVDPLSICSFILSVKSDRSVGCDTRQPAAFFLFVEREGKLVLYSGTVLMLNQATAVFLPPWTFGYILKRSSWFYLRPNLIIMVVHLSI